MNFAEYEDEDEPETVRYAFVLEEEEYEPEDTPEYESYSKELQDNFSDAEAEPPEIQGWDPHDTNFFRII